MQEADALLERELDELRLRLAAIEQRVASRAVRETLPQGRFAALSFRVGHDRFALPLDGVVEVVMVADMATLPEAPVWVCGLLDVRGTIVPVVDAQARMTGCARDVELSDLVVICSDGHRLIGLVVSGVDAVTEVDGAALSLPSRDLPHAAYLSGMLADGAQALLLLSLPRLLSTTAVPETGAEADARTTSEEQGAGQA